MGDNLRKVTSGEPLQIPASTYNLLMDMARDYLASKPTVGRRFYPESQTTVSIKNNTETDLNRFAILGIDNTIITPTANLNEFKSRQTLVGSLPSSTTHASGKFAILAEMIVAGKIGQAYVSGTCQVQINITDESHAFADVKDDDATQLQSAASGPCSILWKESGTGTKWAIVRFGASGGGTVQLCEIMHEPDDGNDYYDIKLDAWADDWEAETWYEGSDKPEWSGANNYLPVTPNSNDNKVKRTDDSNVTYWACNTDTSGDGGLWVADHWTQIYVAIVTHSNREWTCNTSHLSESANAPGLGAQWELVDTTKAYSFTPVGALSHCVPQYARGDKVPYFIDPADSKIKLYATFIQGGENTGTDAEPVWVVRSIGWMKKAIGSGITYWGRAMGLFR